MTNFKSDTKFTYVPLDELPLVCGVCEKAITLQNPIGIHYHYTKFENKFLPELWVCVKCIPFDEVKYWKTRRRREREGILAAKKWREKFVRSSNKRLTRNRKQ